jgi:uncharacterized protein (TIGR02328 family)
MRLFHEHLIPYLPRQQLIGQNRECSALMCKGWGKPHSIVNYIFNYNREKLLLYWDVVQIEMKKRGYRITVNCKDKAEKYSVIMPAEKRDPVYPEHNDRYLVICLYNLLEKEIDLWDFFPHVSIYKFGNMTAFIKGELSAYKKIGEIMK